MKIKSIFATGLVAVTLLSACNNSATQDVNTVYSSYTNTKAKSVSGFYPLEKGRSWTFSLKQFQNDQPNDKFKEMTISIVNNQKDNGFDTAVMKRTYPDSNIQPNQTLAKIFPDHIELSRYVQQSIFEAMGSPKTKSNDSITILNSPVEIGTNWEGRTFQGGTEKISIIGEESLTVPAGVFKTIKVQHHLSYDNGKEDNLYYWYADGVGTVKMYEEITFYSGQWLKMKSIGELKSYTK